MTSLGEFLPVHRESTASLIARQLREAIMYGRIATGSQLSEAALSAQFGVSRGPLREAMQRLVQEGLLRSEPNRGLFVKELDEADIQDIYASRTAIEAAAAIIVLRSNDQESFERLRTACRAMTDAAASGDLTTLSDADFRFHEMIVECARSPRLLRMHQTLIVETRMCLTALQGTYQDPDDQVKEHIRIAEAIIAADEAETLRSVDVHMHEAIKRLNRSVHPA